jgi:catechol 2,3-dioxygenase-like lactoylglutathione lyase family enzyme
VIDLGVVVSDVDASVKFYTEAIGFKEVDGFKVPAGFAKDAGLTDDKPLDIRVLQLGDDENATKLKLMQLPGVKSKKSDNRFIHSQLGISYLTIFVVDTAKALDRLEKAGVKPLAKGPVGLPEPLPQGVFLTVVRDPDGNLIELVGPKK